MTGSDSRVTERTFCDGLEERGFPNVSKANLEIILRLDWASQTGRREESYIRYRF